MGSNLYVSASGAAARLRDLDIVANNLANANTTAFKRQEPIFESALQSAILDLDGSEQPGAPGRIYVKTGAVSTDFGHGSIRRTDRGLDLAIQGEGFFEVETEQGPRYTRVGSFVGDREGYISLPGGGVLMGEGGPIDARGRTPEFDQSGHVLDEQGRRLGRVKLVRFEDVGLLERQGGGLYAAPPGVAPEEMDRPAYAAGSLEKSNVVAVQEMGSMVFLQRLFESSLRAMSADDHATTTLIQEFSR